MSKKDRVRDTENQSLRLLLSPAVLRAVKRAAARGGISSEQAAAQMLHQHLWDNDGSFRVDHADDGLRA